MTICFDLDGTLCEQRTDGQYHLATPYAGRIGWVNHLATRGHRIIIDTARGSGTGTDWRTATEQQLADWGVLYHELRIGEKPAADLYVDDRAQNAVDYFSTVIGGKIGGV